MRSLVAWPLALLALAAAQACAQAPAKVFPDRPAGPVLDLADILPPSDESALDGHLRGYFERTGNAVMVVSVTSLDGRSIEDYATGLFNEWGIGDDRTNRGLLILVAPGERKVRIEVGCGLEAAVTNPVADRIIQHTMLPSFRKGDLRAGTLAGVEALEKRLAATRARGPTSRICRDMMGRAA